jgi:hypothetical protein
MRTIWFLAVDTQSPEPAIRFDGFSEDHDWKPEVGKEFGNEILPCDRDQKFVVVKVFTEAQAQFIDELQKIEEVMRTDYFSDGLCGVVSQCVRAVLKTKMPV